MHTYQIRLRSVGNPDHSQFAPISNPETVSANRLARIRAAVDRYIEEWNLGSGNWPKCPVTRDGEPIGYFSFNRRFWRTRHRRPNSGRQAIPDSHR